MSDIKNAFDNPSSLILDNLSKKYHSKTSLLTSTDASAYTSQFSNVSRLISEEPEILFFLVMQWVTVVAAYLIWVQFFKWIPMDVWLALSDSESESGDAINLLFVAWSFLVIVIASYPLAVLNSAIVAAHNLHACGDNSTIFKSLALATRYIEKIWIFSVIDNWITVTAILDRIPRTKDNRTLSDELLYYAWKVSTITVVPSLLCGKGFTGAASDAIHLYQKCPAKLLSLRLGYSFACWLFGCIVYVVSLSIMCSLVAYFTDMPTFYNIILIAGIPILAAAAFVILVLRPAFLIGIAQIYTDHFDVRSHTKQWMEMRPMDLFLNLNTVLFFMMLLLILMIVIFPDQTGVAPWVERIARASIAH